MKSYLVIVKGSMKVAKNHYVNNMLSGAVLYWEKPTKAELETF